jgi:hypothetical protein
MVARIVTGSNLYGALEYNQQKVDKSVGRVLATHLLSEPVDGKFSVAETVADFHFWMPKKIFGFEGGIKSVPLYAVFCVGC